MKEYQQRVIAERNELNEKIVKLSNFLRDNNEVTGEDRELLSRQFTAMSAYRNILDERISRFL